MPAHDHLGRQFFHATNVELQPGDVLKPGDQIDKTNWPGMDAGHSVWMHTTPEYAAHYGRHVYEVQPESPVENFSEMAGHTEEMESSLEHEWIAPSARVLRKR